MIDEFGTVWPFSTKGDPYNNTVTDFSEISGKRRAGRKSSSRIGEFRQGLISYISRFSMIPQAPRL